MAVAVQKCIAIIFSTLNRALWCACPVATRGVRRGLPRWSILDLVLIPLSLISLALNSSGVMVVRLIRILRVTRRPAPPTHPRRRRHHHHLGVTFPSYPDLLTSSRRRVGTPGKDMTGPLRGVQVVRVFGKVPSLRVLVMALASCVVPAINTFAILTIFISICDLPAAAAAARLTV